MLAFVAPGALTQLTGGYIYDKQIVDGLKRIGYRVATRMVSDRFPNPTAADLDNAARVLASIPNGSVTIVDGLAAGAMPLQIEREAKRLRFVALVHHPLAHETGVSKTDALKLRVDETRSLRYARHAFERRHLTAGGEQEGEEQREAASESIHDETVEESRGRGGAGAMSTSARASTTPASLRTTVTTPRATAAARVVRTRRAPRRRGRRRRSRRD